MQLFIGLTFKASTHSFQKIDSFRRRFDSKYEKTDLLQMTLLPPFSVDSMTNHEFEEFVDLCAEDLESNFIGHDQPLDVDFKGFDFQTGKKNVLFLKPVLPVDLFYAQEVLKDAVKKARGVFHKHKNLGHNGLDDLQTFLPIGRGDDPQLLAMAVEKAQVEFGHAPFQMESQDIVLFEKIPGRWIPRQILYSFNTTNAYAEKEDLPFSTMKTPVNL
ncbi:MAG: hypothetical protein CME63_06840 [Halobacteriovoraceae bacterium]|nr:hypothetical protein [Halobacteriovoraceae bacterium]MBC97447.1 hypothetical protein [Halobacteriovoraceae bacterium]|tara:strand:- start:72485 stop:73132 length:648 start_codon:yes stop_codon:yes gene_type:complete